MIARFKTADSAELTNGARDLCTYTHLKIDGLPLHLYKELEQINLQRKRLKEQLERLDTQAALIESQRRR